MSDVKGVTMKCVVKPKPRRYWTRVIQKAIERKRAGKEPFTPLQIRQAQDWDTCACGKLDGRIPRDLCGQPYDPSLEFLGTVFGMNVLEQRPRSAKATLARMRKREAEVLAEGTLSPPSNA